MRKAALALISLAAGLVAGCTTTSKTHPGRVQTTSQAEHETVEGAVSAPLRDLNLLRTKIPGVLLDALADPYGRPPPNSTCSQLVALVEPLDVALGADLDAPEKKAETLTARGRGATLGAVAGATSDVIPFRSWIRKLSGAERHDSYVRNAITAGFVRRAYLKGLGEAQGCLPPATPSHLLANRPSVDQEIKPRYPTRLSPPAPGTPGDRPPAQPPQ
jgi:hypothetical protein